MTMNRKELLHSVILSAGYVLLFIGISNITTNIIDQYAPFFLLGGAMILYYKDKIANSIPLDVFSGIIVQAVGMILLFLAFKTYAGNYINGNTAWFILIGLIIYNYAWPITRMLIKSEERIERL